MRYKIIIPTGGGKPLQAFADTEPAVRQLAEQYLGMLPPGKRATIYEIVDTPLFTVTSSMEETSKGKPIMQFQIEKEDKNEQAVS